MNVVIVNRQRTRKINPWLLKEIAEALLADLQIKEAELGVNLVTSTEMTLLNETFLRHEGPTDVITFDYLNSESGIRDSELKLHGELFICLDEAVMQARKFDTDWQSEIVRYVVHGVLHLLGHDDLRAVARRKMKREENRLLRALSRRFSLADISRPAKLAA